MPHQASDIPLHLKEIVAQYEIAECLAILVIFIIIIAVFARRNSKVYALAVLPLMLLPFVHTVSVLICFRLTPHLPFSLNQIVLCADLLALVVSGIFIGINAKPMAKKPRALYTCCAGIFAIVLSTILII